VNQFACNPIRRRADAGHRTERVGVDEGRDVPIQSQHRLCGALVSPAALAVAGERGHVEEQSSYFQVDIAHFVTPRYSSAIAAPEGIMMKS
jgi:hypothetical protein